MDHKLMKQFGRIASIGNYCLTKYQINRHICRKYFSMQPNSTALAARMINEAPKAILETINGSNALFDWTVILDYDKLASMLEYRTDYKLNIDNLKERRRDDGSLEGIFDAANGILWVHLFSNDPSSPHWRDQAPALQSKVDHLMSNFIKLREHETLYIATVNISDKSDLPDRLLAAIRKSRGDRAPECSLLICGDKMTNRKDDGGIYFRPISFVPDLPQYPWLGNVESWDRIFSEFSFSASVEEIRSNMSTLDARVQN
jgi:hypothetical protein